MEDIEDKLDQNLLDLKRTDCSIVFAGKFVIYLWLKMHKCVNEYIFKPKYLYQS